MVCIDNMQYRVIQFKLNPKVKNILTKFFIKEFIGE